MAGATGYGACPLTDLSQTSTDPLCRRRPRQGEPSPLRLPSHLPLALTRLCPLVRAEGPRRRGMELHGASLHSPPTARELTSTPLSSCSSLVHRRGRTSGASSGSRALRPARPLCGVSSFPSVSLRSPSSRTCVPLSPSPPRTPPPSFALELTVFSSSPPSPHPLHRLDPHAACSSSGRSRAPSATTRLRGGARTPRSPRSARRRQRRRRAARTTSRAAVSGSLCLWNASVVRSVHGAQRGGDATEDAGARPAARLRRFFRESRLSPFL